TPRGSLSQYYTTATAGAPQIGGVAANRLVTWTLSEPAPESWWAVLRSRNGAPFEVAARVRAGATTQMSWNDKSLPGNLRYKIRRECVDTRYQAESAEGGWPRLAHPIPIKLHVKNPFVDGADVMLSGAAAGPVDIQLYDLQGRLMLRTKGNASGIGEESV